MDNGFFRECGKCNKTHDIRNGIEWTCVACGNLNSLENAVEPSHYTDLKISPLEYITKNEGEFTWCIANVIKYVSRYKRKNGLEDLKKARWYLDYQIKLEEERL